ncbi:hypothetical protein DFR58_11782 [Anaerobacterium chartisolvens]|uniref:Calcineurin-like phosphoesterase domain-containing protein n=1 Tax=Anaerobacterium chartisolvens TaxID=1297424 RepID=A0A369AVX6_9FIRM|nr:metallophosphoesterase [Anaerobacterium chartisolvens]RCX13542.1 hypothetical protein DFR58_11782 [Anaerobacterium chartisolvens]
MAVFAISDLHLALSIDKPMDIFGARWENYMQKLEQEWRDSVSPEDWVIVPGDISWATYLEQAVADFEFIESLPGTKIISKGNHDYWWTTMNKLEKFIGDKGFSSIRFMHNNSFRLGNMLVCGTRGWKCPGDNDFGAEDVKIYQRELQRLELSLKSIDIKGEDEITVALHYPPFNARQEPTDFVSLMEAHNVNTCLYGHLHGESCRNAVTGYVRGIHFRFISADYLGFKPLKILD